MKLPTARATPPHGEKRSVLTTLVFGLILLALLAELPLDADNVMYHGRWRSVFVVLAPLVSAVPGISISPWQILLIALVPFCLGTTDATQRHAREMDRAIFASIACIALTVLWGLVHGGSAYFAYYQLWHFLAALLIAYSLMSTVRSERDLIGVGKVIILAALIRATLCIYVYWAYVYGKVDNPDYVTNHDDSMLWVVAVLILSTWALLKGGRAMRIFAAVAVPCMLYAMVLNNRRIVWVELGLGVVLIYFLLGPGPLRSRINRWTLMAAPVLLIYIVVGLGSNSAVFAPVHSLVTVGSNNDASSLTRLEEDRNLLHTLFDVGNPIFGTGWGRPYDKLESYFSNYDARWILYLYTPHNSLLGLAAFSGLVGLIGIWGVVPVGAYLAARGYRGAIALVPRTAGIAALGSLAAYGAHCYGDIGLQSFSGAVLFGAALGSAGKIAAWSELLVTQTATTREQSVYPSSAPRTANRKGTAPRQRMSGKPGRAPVQRPPR
jgi:hypothetical protein